MTDRRLNSKRTSDQAPASAPDAPGRIQGGVEAVVLAGGQSRRMGRDKARLRIDGRSMIQRSGDAARALGIPVRVIRRDLVPQCGPMGGVCTALERSRAETVVFLSCDMPSVEPTLIRRLLARLSPRRDAAFVESEGWVGFPFAIRSRARPAVWQLHADGHRSLQSIADGLQAARLRVGSALRKQLLNVNTPETWAAFKGDILARVAANRRTP
ncbi:MAG: molybdenum cofactor guanylyltransferase [Limisphaerales bacterium]